jgi:hypothetical protein
MTTLNLKTIASGFFALVVVAFLSVTLVDATAVARIHRTGSADFLAGVSALVR